MPTHRNALEELTRFWLQLMHGCLVEASMPVAVRHGFSSIDIVAVQSALQPITVCQTMTFGPRLIVETKDEHDSEPTGREYGAYLRGDIAKMGEGRFIPRGNRAMKFAMLQEEQFEAACQRFGTDDFDRVFVVHAMDRRVLEEYRRFLLARRIHFLGAREMVADLQQHYTEYDQRAGLRHSLVGDLWHLLVGFCDYGPKDQATAPPPIAETPSTQGALGS